MTNLNALARPFTSTMDTPNHRIDPWLVDGLVRENELLCISGPPRSGATSITAMLGAHIAGGLPFGSLNTQQRNVLFVTTDDLLTEHKAQPKSDSGGGQTLQSFLNFQFDYRRLGIKAMRDRYRVLNWTQRDQLNLVARDGRPTADMYEIINACQRFYIGLVIIDDIGRMFDGNATLESDTAPVIDMLERNFATHGRSCIVVARAETRALPFPSLNGFTVARNDDTAIVRSRGKRGVFRVDWGKTAPLVVDTPRNAFATFRLENGTGVADDTPEESKSNG